MREISSKTIWIHNSRNSCMDLQSHNFIPTLNKYYNNFGRVFMPKISIWIECKAPLLIQKLYHLKPKTDSALEESQQHSKQIWFLKQLHVTTSLECDYLQKTSSCNKGEWGGDLHLGKVPPTLSWRNHPSNKELPSVKHVNLCDARESPVGDEVWVIMNATCANGSQAHEVATKQGERPTSKSAWAPSQCRR